jgi:polyisoprenoid-binding protein YceI
VTSTQTVAVPLGRYRLDKLHSHVGFAVKHMVVATFRGEFKDIEATLVSSEDGIRLEGSVPVGSISVDDRDLRAHLLSPEFFDVVRTPEIRFASSDVRVDDRGAVVLHGELTMKGITRPLRALGTLTGPIVDLSGCDRLGLELEATVDRRAHDLNWNMPLPSGGLAVANEVTLIASLALLREDV